MRQPLRRRRPVTPTARHTRLGVLPTINSSSLAACAVSFESLRGIEPERGTTSRMKVEPGSGGRRRHRGTPNAR